MTTRERFGRREQVTFRVSLVGDELQYTERLEDLEPRAERLAGLAEVWRAAEEGRFSRRRD